MRSDDPVDNGFEEELDSELWESFRRHVRDLSPSPPPYESITNQSVRSLRLPWPSSEQTRNRIWFVAAAAAVVLVTTAIAWTSQTVNLQPTHSDETTPSTNATATTLAPFDLNEQLHEPPLCWLDLTVSPPTGACRQGTIGIIEINYPESESGWQGVVSGLELPTGWSAVTYHRRWNKPEPERTGTQGYVVHPASDSPQSIDFYQDQFEIIRDPDSSNGGNCSKWPGVIPNTEVIIENEIVGIPGETVAGGDLNDNVPATSTLLPPEVSCIYFTPDLSNPGHPDPLKLTTDNRSQELVIRYDNL